MKEYANENKGKSVWYCCQCKKNTNGRQDCHTCGHMKGRWDDDTHHCQDY